MTSSSSMYVDTEMGDGNIEVMNNWYIQLTEVGLVSVDIEVTYADGFTYVETEVPVTY
ncbi:hypothetical protein [Bacillus sp. JCM 19034]|uniref:hypothetical protein n=1 Tax=Bacillus sp. JCM 19034 TaxID=1481928 RepID=UPI000AF31A94|nr:hypothetical protein [Bacillus sp. JCM 19034]